MKGLPSKFGAGYFETSCTLVKWETLDLIFEVGEQMLHESRSARFRKKTTQMYIDIKWKGRTRSLPHQRNSSADVLDFYCCQELYFKTCTKLFFEKLFFFISSLYAVTTFFCNNIFFYCKKGMFHFHS